MLVPEIPQRGLREVFSVWSGRGEIIEALAASSGGLIERRWSARQVTRRVNRVIFPELALLIDGWPDDTLEWINALPAESIRESFRTPFPRGGVDWPSTRIAGWPPRHFVGVGRSRGFDSLLLTTLKWVLEQLIRVRQDAIDLVPELSTMAELKFGALERLCEEEPLRSTVPTPPSYTDVAALRREGHPWGAVSQVCEFFLALDDAEVETMLARLIVPDPDLLGRLFHLAVLGELLIVLQESGFSIVSKRPLASNISGPAYVLHDRSGIKWDLWFEAAGAFSHYTGSGSPYIEIAKAVRGENRSLGADLALIQYPKTAILIECKYSANPARVARSGYHQAVTYAVEARDKLCREVVSCVVGPEGVVTSARPIALDPGAIWMLPPSEIAKPLRSLGICSMLSP